MIIDEEPFQTHQAVNITYELEDFAKDEYLDAVVPVQILMVMMGFCILLISQLFNLESDKLIKGTSLFCGFFLFNIFYVLYD